MNLPKLRRRTMDAEDSDDFKKTRKLGFFSLSLEDELPVVSRSSSPDPHINQGDMPKSDSDVDSDTYSDQEDPEIQQEPAEVKVSTKRRGRPKKVQTESIEPEGPKRKRGRPKKGQEPVEANLVVVDLSEGSIAMRKRRRQASTPPVETAPAPLTKVRRNGGQLPLTIDVERLITDSNRDKRFKLNTIDVLKHLIKEFEPIDMRFPNINSTVVQNDFKTHLLDYVNHLSDIHGSISDLNHEITKVRKEKDEMRQNIFKTMKEYKQVKEDLNKIRADYHQSEKEYQEFMGLTEELNQIKKNINHNTIDPIDQIKKNLPVLNKLYNGTNGLAISLKEINDKLAEVKTITK